MSEKNDSETSDEAAGPAVIGQSIYIDGTVQGDQDLVVRGNVEGAIQLTDAKVEVAESGHVIADITAKIIEVGGTVRGELRATESVTVRPSGKLTGNIRAPRVILSDGCQFKGNVDMEQKGDQHADRARAMPSVKNRGQMLGLGAASDKLGADKGESSGSKPASVSKLKGKPSLLKT